MTIQVKKTHYQTLEQALFDRKSRTSSPQNSPYRAMQDFMKIYGPRGLSMTIKRIRANRGHSSDVPKKEELFVNPLKEIERI